MGRPRHLECGTLRAVTAETLQTQREAGVLAFAHRRLIVAMAVALDALQSRWKLAR
jgi:hypothetical protein